MPHDIPQRFPHNAPPGSLFKQRPQVKQRLRRQRDEAKDARHLAAIRQLPCLKCGMEPCGEAAHVRMSSAAFGKASGIGKKPPDRFTVPLCPSCHRQDKDAQHQIGEGLFWHLLGINPLLACEQLYAASPEVVRMRAIVFTFIAGRT